MQYNSRQLDGIYSAFQISTNVIQELTAVMQMLSVLTPKDRTTAFVNQDLMEMD